MRRKASDRKEIRILAVSSIVLAAFSVLIWRNVLAYSGKVVLTTDGPRHASGSRPGPTESATAAGQAARESVGVPVRIRIPSIAVDAAIEKVTLAADGSMDVPKDPLDAAWYALGPRPGETGSAAIAGHVDWKHGATAVFADLHKLRPGDIITVQDDKGADISFVVHKSRKYDAAADAIDVFSSNDGKARLNIITCYGAWDKGAKQYSQRLVVFADRETE